MAKLGSASRDDAGPARARAGHQVRQLEGQLREAGGPPARRPLDRRAVHGHQRRQARSRSTRACRTCRRARRFMTVTGLPQVAAPELAFAVRGARRVEHTAVPTLAFAIAVEAPAGAAIRSVLLDVQLQIAARRRAYDEASHDAAVRALRTGRRVGPTLRTLLWTRTTLVVPAVHRRHRRRPARAVHVRHRGARHPLPRRARATARCRSSSCSAAPSSTPARAGCCRRRGSRGSRRPGSGCPSRVWRETMDRHFPGTAWLRLRQGALRPARRVSRPRHALATLGRRDRRAAAGRRPGRAVRRPSARDRRRGALRGLPAVAVPPLGD